MDVSERLERWVRSHFDPSDAEAVLEELRSLTPQGIGGQDPERVQAALVIKTNGDWERFQRNLNLVRRDWRDSLVAADLANGDWPDRLDAVLDD